MDEPDIKPEFPEPVPVSPEIPGNGPRADRPDKGPDAQLWRRKKLALPLALVLVGCGLLARELDVPLPSWVFTWQMALILFGVIAGFLHRFCGAGWLIPILVGLFFLFNEYFPGLAPTRFIWPALLILVGIILLAQPKMNCSTSQTRARGRDNKWKHEARHWDRRWRRDWAREWSREQSNENYRGSRIDSEDLLDVTAVFGGINKTILSKDFKGGDITIFMGGMEINLTSADINGKALIDVTQIFGNTKLIVPPNWDIRSELTTVFGSIEDKREKLQDSPTQKVLVINGTSVFGSIQIVNF